MAESFRNIYRGSGRNCYLSARGNSATAEREGSQSLCLGKKPTNRDSDIMDTKFNIETFFFNISRKNYFFFLFFTKQKQIV